MAMETPIFLVSIQYHINQNEKKLLTEDSREFMWPADLGHQDPTPFMPIDSPAFEFPPPFARRNWLRGQDARNVESLVEKV